ncbi:hypothetical protein FEDK69T_24960 [Flavobacterium enshiense DK69]|nr:hypothetical protein FEDK69T_24960 [Flavobacterium enshiense DK69]
MTIVNHKQLPGYANSGDFVSRFSGEIVSLFCIFDLEAKQTEALSFL